MLLARFFFSFWVVKGGKGEGMSLSHLVESCHRLIRAANLNLVKESLRAIAAFTRALCYIFFLILLIFKLAISLPRNIVLFGVGR